ncbi:MAG TPA: TonB-dependent receptor [Caulobacteraceae bacterium]|nr:TonB-dependent receptor [Caulobacteraceae bacterium]
MKTSSRLGARLLCGAAAAAILVSAGAAQAEERPVRFEIPAQPLTAALNEFGIQSGSAVLFKADVTGARLSRPLSGAVEPETALTAMLDGTGLSYRRDGDAFVIVQGGSGDPQSDSAAGGGAEVEALIVTAQKKEEDIQDVPIAISAFTQTALEEQKIEGGFDLMKAIPNVTFSKSNFTSYNFSIRGVGTKAISATTDPGVAVAFNNTTLIQNRLFEQEYFDVERVEVLRGPQGTLYGRNATSGVINVISAKPDLNDLDASLKLELGNYATQRVSGMVNVPLIEDALAVRVAGAWTKRDGYDYNEITDRPVNGRDLWSARVTVGFEPTEWLRGNLIWEHFEEDDDRSRTGKQLCHRDAGRQTVGNTAVVNDPANPFNAQLRPALFSQGCLPGSLYDDGAFDMPNGLALPFVFAPLALGADCGPLCPVVYPLGRNAANRPQTLLQIQDPYASGQQSRDLRTIASILDPRYRAKADVIELNLDIDLGESLTLYSQTAYNEDEVYSFQDFNRFNTQPIFTDTLTLGTTFDGDFRQLAPEGVFCDPQIGCSNRMAAFDVSQAEGKQFSQEIRLQSSFDGPVNFSLGANYTEFETLVDYYVFNNLLTALAVMPPLNAPGGPVDLTFSTCSNSAFFHLFGPGSTPVPTTDPRATCPYVDPNPLNVGENFQGEGHNYFRSKNPYKLKSKAIFGELYWDLAEDLKLTAGLRYTEDQKKFIPVPSQTLLSPGFRSGGLVNRGYPENDPIYQEWGEWTGRLGVDWQPELGFTDQTMLYAFYSRGYKGGGANPPSPGFATFDEALAQAQASGAPQFFIDQWFFGSRPLFPVLQLTAVEYERTFEPEFVDAFEVGAKNTLLEGALMFNANAFFYDYRDYQVSQIRDRTAVNENFDAQVWGLEFETRFAPSRNLQIIANLGYLDTKIADGESSIDIMNRTQGNDDYVLVKPWVQLPSNCVVPVGVAERYLNTQSALGSYWTICGGVRGFLALTPFTLIDPSTGQPYDVSLYDGTNGRADLNGGAGIRDDLGGNELPNAPHWTMNLGAQYGIDLAEGWRMTLRGDAYWQSQSWHRVYNADPYDKLHGWYNANLSVWLEDEDGLKIELYAKNILNDTPITDAFLNSDDAALTTNVFTLDPRLIGLSIRKEF